MARERAPFMIYWIGRASGRPLAGGSDHHPPDDHCRSRMSIRQATSRQQYKMDRSLAPRTNGARGHRRPYKVATLTDDHHHQLRRLDTIFSLSLKCFVMSIKIKLAVHTDQSSRLS